VLPPLVDFISIIRDVGDRPFPDVRCLRYPLSTPRGPTTKIARRPFPPWEITEQRHPYCHLPACDLVARKRHISAPVDRRRHRTAAGALSPIYLKSNPRPPTPSLAWKLDSRTRPGPPIVHGFPSRRFPKLEKENGNKCQTSPRCIPAGIDDVRSFRQRLRPMAWSRPTAMGYCFAPPWPLSASIERRWIERV
jgi:hypothetical protein